MIFVTGGSGFLGSYILQELVLQGKPVRALKRGRGLPQYLSPQLSEKILWVEGDILDVPGLVEHMEGCDQIIHAAGMVSFVPSDKTKLYQVNIEGTANMVNAALETGIRDFVHISSVAALGKDEPGKITDEEKKWESNKDQSSYGVSKYYGEMEVWRGMGEGLSPLIVNPATLLGYGNWNESSCGLFKTAFEEFPWYTEGSSGFADVQDTAKVILALANSGMRNERFIVSSENKTYREVLGYMSAGFGKIPAAKKAGPFLAGLAWRKEKIKSLFSGYKPLITRESIAIASHQSGYSNRKLLKVLPDFRFRTVENSIGEACSKYLESLFKPKT